MYFSLIFFEHAYLSDYHSYIHYILTYCSSHIDGGNGVSDF